MYSRFFSFIFFLIINIYYTQNTIVKYEEYRKFENQKNISFLIFNNQESFNIQVYHKDYESFKDLLSDESFVKDKNYIRSLKKSFDDKNIFYGVSKLPNFGFIIYKDNLPIIHWNLHNEKAKILGYDCFLATATFRGRDYKVWYSSEIPSQCGPWKLSNLPGLIMKVDVDNGAFLFEATSIIFNSSLTVPQKYIDLYKNNSEKIISYDYYIKLENEVFEDIRQKQISALPKGVVLDEYPPIRTTFLEKTLN